MQKKIRRSKRPPKIGILIFALFIIPLVIAPILSLVFWIKKPAVISPVATNNQVLSTKIEKLLLDAHIAYTFVSRGLDSSYVVELLGGGQIILSSQKNIQRQISSLQAMLKELTIKGIRFKSIDFRFDKPVVIFINDSLI